MSYTHYVTIVQDRPMVGRVVSTFRTTEDCVPNHEVACRVRLDNKDIVGYAIRTMDAERSVHSGGILATEYPEACEAVDKKGLPAPPR